MSYNWQIFATIQRDRGISQHPFASCQPSQNSFKPRPMTRSSFRRQISHITAGAYKCKITCGSYVTALCFDRISDVQSVSRVLMSCCCFLCGKYEQTSYIFSFLFHQFCLPSSAFPYHLGVARQRYNEYVLCLKRNDADEDVCKKQKALAYSICPDDWVRTRV